MMEVTIQPRKSLYSEFVGKNVVVVSKLPIVMCGSTNEGTVPVTGQDGNPLAAPMYACRLEAEDGDALVFSTVHTFADGKRTTQRFVVQAAQVQVHLAETSSLITAS